MDQDSFRQLLQISSSRAAPSSRPGVKQAKTISASEPAFKPRKVKKEAKYRDRAAERRVGGGNDYAQARIVVVPQPISHKVQVEAVLEDFNKRTVDQGKDVVDAQRGYLGGDSEHTILVKGLDVALLEQNKVKAAASSVDDDTLEIAFLGEISESTVPKKRTREDIVRELKSKRSKTGDSQQPSATTDAPLPSSKFKPIGLKPINQGDAETKKKKKVKKNGDVEKKKRKVELTVKPEDTSQIAPSEPPKDSPDPLPALKPEPELPRRF
ncbi:RED-like protein N-terminal region-domain-containing protein [Armillaria borealis]|uniref:RED-like protein N-terminal region-domain-containing protein n=1 Tax=Armillaria borealis TaxID=47425 RepID=A0AA39J9C1_9AGAR|nr:RED-like protein N-terminal region-domain-containing protein [Armillaria borealis]